jgi:hypothetical protein
MTYPVSDAQACPLERVGVVSCWDKPAIAREPTYIILILLGRGTNHLTDLGEMEMDGNKRHKVNATARRPVASAAVRCMWEISGQIAPCRLIVYMFRIAWMGMWLMENLPRRSLRAPFHTRFLHLEHEMRIKTTVVSVSRLTL